MNISESGTFTAPRNRTWTFQNLALLQRPKKTWTCHNLALLQRQKQFCSWGPWAEFCDSHCTWAARAHELEKHKLTWHWSVASQTPHTTRLKHFYSATLHTATALLFSLLGDWCLLLLVKHLALSGAVWNWCYMNVYIYMSLIVFPCFSYFLLSPFVVTILFLFLVVVFCWSRAASSLDRWRASASTFFLRAPSRFFSLALTEIKEQMCVKSWKAKGVICYFLIFTFSL